MLKMDDMVKQAIENVDLENLTPIILKDAIKSVLLKSTHKCDHLTVTIMFNIPQVIIVVLNDKAHFIKTDILEKYAIERDNIIAQDIADFVNANIERINRDMSLIEMIAFGKLMQHHTVTLIENVEKQGDNYLISFSNNKSITLENINGKFEYKIA